MKRRSHQGRILEEVAFDDLEEEDLRETIIVSSSGTWFIDLIRIGSDERISGSFLRDPVWVNVIRHASLTGTVRS